MANVLRLVMLKTKLQQSYLAKTVEVKHHGRLYFVNKAKLNFILNKIGMYAKFNFLNDDLRDFLFQNRLLYTEFLQYISDGVEISDK